MRLRPWTLARLGFHFICSVIVLPLVASEAATSPTNFPPPTLRVHLDGSVSASAIAEAGPGRLRLGVRRVFAFGLPTRPPTQRELESGKLPIVRTQWEHNRIRYTQTVLLTRLNPEGWFSEEALAADSVLVVQITGENTAGEYTEATAEFGVRAEGRTLELELRDGRVRATGAGETDLVAVIDVPATGIAGTQGTGLRFRGSMPPGTSGAMTVKIPLAPLTDAAAMSRLSDLEFDDEFRRVKRFWTERLKDAATVAMPLAFAESEIKVTPTKASE